MFVLETVHAGFLVQIFVLQVTKHRLKFVSSESLQIALPFLPWADAYGRKSCATGLHVCVRSSKRALRVLASLIHHPSQKTNQPHRFLFCLLRSHEDAADESTRR